MEDCSPTEGRKLSLHRMLSGGELSNDINIQGTNDDASECKLFAINLGYWNDPFLAAFTKISERKPPEINMGYWARCFVIRNLVIKFLKSCGSNAQIVSLGAGYDTLYWQLYDLARNGIDPVALPLKYVEVDFPTITAKKIHHIMKPHGQRILLNALADSAEQLSICDHAELHSPRGYHLLASDLRDSSALVKHLVAEAGLSTDLPTLFLCECVMVYMTAEQSSSLLSTLAQTFSQPCFLNYEQVNIDDKFGQIMQDNLHLRGVNLAGLLPCRSLETQMLRFYDNGWNRSDAKDMNFVYSRLPESERRRIERIEMLDELELLTQLLHHYCVCIASKNADNVFSAMQIT